MSVGDVYVFPGFLTPVLTQLFFPKPPTTFLTCFCRGERRNNTGEKSRFNRGSKSQPPGNESDTLTTDPPGLGLFEKSTNPRFFWFVNHIKGSRTLPGDSIGCQTKWILRICLNPRFHEAWLFPRLLLKTGFWYWFHFIFMSKCDISRLLKAFSVFFRRCPFWCHLLMSATKVKFREKESHVRFKKS